MSRFKSFRTCKPDLHTKYKGNTWFNEATGYLIIRYHPIETRVVNTTRYVELAPQNSRTFSFEYGSIIRDIGSVFASVLDKFVRKTTSAQKDEYDIRHYRKFLTDEIENIDLIGVQLKSPFMGNMVLPFDEIKDTTTRLDWWDAYNNLKHSDIDSVKDGCLTNVVYGMASLAVLLSLMKMSPAIDGRLFMPAAIGGRLFSRIGYFKPINTMRERAFPKQSDTDPTKD